MEIKFCIIVINQSEAATVCRTWFSHDAITFLGPKSAALKGMGANKREVMPRWLQQTIIDCADFFKTVFLLSN